MRPSRVVRHCDSSMSIANGNGRQGRGEIRRDPLDEQVAVQVGGFRWVEWNHAALRGAPLDAPGRFLAPPDHFLWHLQIPADPSTPPAQHPLRLVPRFSNDLGQAMRAAERAGLFSRGHAVLRRKGSGNWCIEADEGRIRLEGERLPALICEASLVFVHGLRESGDL